MSVYDEKYIKAKIRELNGVIETNFLCNEIPKENVHYACIACITINLRLRTTPFSGFQDYFSFSHFLASSYCF